MREYLKKTELSTFYCQLLNNYDHLPEISIDYKAVEKKRRSIVIPYSGLWKDLGSSGALSGQLQGAVRGKGSLSEDSQNTQIVNELSIPIHAISISNTPKKAADDPILPK